MALNFMYIWMCFMTSVSGCVDMILSAGHQIVNRYVDF